MILADTSIWIRFFRDGGTDLRALLESGSVVIHEFVIGELACGNLRDRRETLADLNRLPVVHGASTAEVLFMIERHGFQGRGLGWVDLHLLAASRVGHLTIYTLDHALAKAAVELGVAYQRSARPIPPPRLR